MPRTLVDLINQKIVPPVFIAFFTLTAPFLAVAGNPDKSFQTSFIWGNLFAWKFIAALFTWGLIWLWIPAKAFYGPPSNFGYIPKYKANGEIYYFVTMAAFGVITYFKPQIWVSTYENMGPIVGGLNIVALSLCLYLLIKAKLKKEESDPYLIKKFPIVFEFYRGMELHPRILGVDVKQLTNSRIACILWQLLPLIFFSAAYQTKGFDCGLFVNVLLQTIYIYKFYKWETGYFTTMDMTLDRTGYYLCWGTLVWVPAFYTFHSYIFVYYPSNCGPNLAALILILGAASIWLNYEVDRQKEMFLASKGIKLMIWGQEAKTVKVSYITATGKERKSELLISGWWGVARKINYTFELAATFMWSVPGGLSLGVWPFLPNIFVAGLLIHRIFRDEKKCQAKYGKGWNEYCKKVPYRLVPYIF